MRALTIACALLAATAASPAERTMMDGDVEFAAALHEQLRAHSGNLFYSPVSVRVALAMAMVGARGATEAELARALSLPAGAAGARAVAAQLADWDRLAHPRTRLGHARERAVLRVVSRVWAQRNRKFSPEFTRAMHDLFRAPLGTVDFERDGPGARRAINHWVADATQQRIRELIGDGALPADSKMVLTDAVYFNAGWREPFDASSTSPDRFFVGEGQTRSVPLMHRLGHEKVARVDGALVLEQPYSDDRLVMDIVLPTARDGLGAIEHAYVGGALVGWLQALAFADVDITLPKLQLSSTLDLAPALERLGVVHATSRVDADFSGIDGARDLYVGAVIHQAVVDVDEHSTEAAAATAVEEGDKAPMPDLTRPPPPIVFRADHPFLFVIRDATAGVVLFAGRVVDPSSR